MQIYTSVKYASEGYLIDGYWHFETECIVMIRVWRFGEPGIVEGTSINWREGTDVEALESERIV
jgi:hypothetical protein